MSIDPVENWFPVVIGCKFLWFTFHLEMVEIHNIFKKRFSRNFSILALKFFSIRRIVSIKALVMINKFIKS